MLFAAVIRVEIAGISLGLTSSKGRTYYFTDMLDKGGCTKCGRAEGVSSAKQAHMSCMPRA